MAVAKPDYIFDMNFIEGQGVCLVLRQIFSVPIQRNWCEYCYLAYILIRRTNVGMRRNYKF